jgi:hypothetical protein
MGGEVALWLDSSSQAASKDVNAAASNSKVRGPLNDAALPTKLRAGSACRSLRVPKACHG